LTDFYTNVSVYGSKILFRGVQNGRKVRHKVDYFPTFFVSADKPSDYTTIHGEYLKEIKPGSIRECRDFIKKYEDVQGFKIYGNNKFDYAFIADEYPDDIDWDIDLINIANVDIEVDSENGFPEPATASEEITAIAMEMNGKMTVYGCKDYNNYDDTVTYYKCRDEIDLIKRFIDDWTGNYPDIITGWNIKFFDIPYLVNRIRKLLGEEMAKRLSPWNYLGERTITMMGRDQTAYLPSGIAILDYIELYKKFAPGGQSQDSYKLDNIAHVELGKRKLSYEEYGSLHKLYRTNYQKFIEYNIQDVRLVGELDDKLKLIELALTLAYDSKTNYEDVFAQVRMWDALIYNHLKKKNVVVPPIERHHKDAAYVGAYVKDPIIGAHKWIASFDLNSLYPHLIMQWNISPETLVEPKDYTDIQRNTLTKTNVDTLLNKEVDTSNLGDFTLSPNGQFFRKDRHGFLPEMMQTMYNDRSAYKNKAIAAKKELELETDPTKRFEIEKRIARFNNLQLAKKVSLNSAYGALGNEFFRFFDVRQASAITTSGQLAIRWIEKKLNEYMNGLLKTKDADYIIASDTDSVYLNMAALVDQVMGDKPTLDCINFMDKVCENKIQPFIDKSYQELALYVHAYEQKMQMKREALADKGIWTAKKRYILKVWNNEGVAYAKPKVKVMGLEMIKSSTPSVCRAMFWEAINIALNGVEDDMIAEVENFRNEFKKAPLSDIAFPRGVNGLEKFADPVMIYKKGTPQHVRASLIYNHLIRDRGLSKEYEFIQEGEKIRFVHLKEPNPFQSDVIAFPTILPKELGVEPYIDYDNQFEKAFVDPLKIILDCIGWKTEKVSSLESFFT
jgi:DNA polymerase elongation subunit (family B)